MNNDLSVVRKADTFDFKVAHETIESKLKVPEHFVTLTYIADSLITLNCTDTVYLYSITEKSIINKFCLNKIVNTCFRDIEGNYWFATTGYGVYRLGSSAFRNYNLQMENNFLPVYSIAKSENLLFVGTNQSILWRIDSKRKIISNEKVADELGEARVTGVIKESERLILGTNQGIIYRNKHFQKNFFPDVTVKTIFRYNDSVLVSTNRNVFSLLFKNP